MSIKVTKHAIRRYRERLFDYSSSDEIIISAIHRIARQGKIVGLKPNEADNCVEIKHKGIAVVVKQFQHGWVVITCLGKDNYRKWIKSQAPYTFLSQKLLYDN